MSTPDDSLEDDAADEAAADEAAADEAAADEATADGDAIPEAPAVGHGVPRSIDFADPGRRPAVDALVAAATGRLATALGRELEAALRFGLSCTAAPTSRRSHAELVDGLVTGAPCVPLALADPAGEAWLLLDRTLAFALADRRYGGTGGVVDDGRALSASERRLCATVRASACRALERAWASVTPLRVTDAGAHDAEGATGDTERFARARGAGPWHECPIEIDVGSGPARCTVLLEHSTVAPLVAPASAPVVHRLEHAGAFGGQLAAGVSGCDVELVGVLAERATTLGELASLRSGDFLALDERRPVRFRAEGRAVFDARLGLDAGRLCASVTRLHLSIPED